MGFLVVDVRPRSPRHAAIIRQDFVEAASVLADFEQELDEEDKSWLAQTRDEAAAGR